LKQFFLQDEQGGDVTLSMTVVRQVTILMHLRCEIADSHRGKLSLDHHTGPVGLCYIHELDLG
jgi:hypothetical protein